MPNYTFKNKETGEEFTESMTIADLEKYLKDNPNIQQLIVSAPSLGDPMRLGVKKNDQGFKDVLREIKKKHPLSNGITHLV